MIDIDLKIDCFKNKLLDLGKRNKLINYCQTKKTSIFIENPDLSVIYNKLVINQKKLVFKDKWQNKDGSNIDIKESIILGSNEEITVIESGNKTDIPKQFQTLISIRDRGVAALKERGTDVLYLAFGLLNWIDAKNKTRKLTSPVVLVPVQVSSENVYGVESFFVSKVDLPVIVNPTLALMLELDYGFVLPKLNNENQSIMQYLKLLSKQLSGYKWVDSISHSCLLGVFSFFKMSLYNDIEKNRETIKASELMQTIIGVKQPKGHTNADTHENTNNKQVEIHNVVIADSSQNEIIKKVVSGESLVITGGIGTGKSMVAANIIANMLRKNKKVLFVTDNNTNVNSVWNELVSVGLSEHILMLQNYKVDVGEVMISLEQALKYASIKGINDKSSYLVDDGIETHENVMEVDQIPTPLGVALYEVLLAIDKLKDGRNVKDVSLDIDNILDVTHEKLSGYVKYIYEIFKYITANKSTILNNVWSSCNIYKYDGNENKEFIPIAFNVCNELNNNLLKLNRCVKEINNKANIFDIIDINSIEALIDIKDKCSSSKAFPSEWMEYTDFSTVRKEVNEFVALQEQIMWANQNIILSSEFDRQEIDAKAMLDNIIIKCDTVRKLLNSKKYISDEDIVTMCDTLIDKLKKANDTLVTAYRYSEYISVKYGIPKSVSINDFVTSMKFIKEVSKNPRPTARWFESVQKVALGKLLESSKEMFETLKNNIKEVDRYVNESIFAIDCEGLLKRFTEEYTQSKILILNKAYRTDKQLIKACLKDSNAKLDDSIITDILTKIKGINKTREWIKKNEETLSVFFGKHYIGEQTNWDNIKSKISIFNNIQSRFDNMAMPTKLKDVLIKGIDDVYEVKNNTLEYQVEEAVEILTEELVEVGYTDKDMLKLSKSVVYVIRILKGISQSYDQVKQYHKEGTPFSEIILNLRSIDFAKQCYSQFYAKEARIKEICCGMYNATDTNFSDILNRIDFATIFVQLNAEYNFSDKFIRKVCNKENFINTIFDDKILIEEILTGIRQYQNIMYDYSNIFSDSKRISDKCFDSQILELELRLKDLESLQVWITYLRIADSAKEKGISVLLEQIISGEISSSKECVDAFLLAFYLKLIEAVVKSNKELSRFVTCSAENKIKMFDVLKKRQKQEMLYNTHVIIQDMVLQSCHLCARPDINQQKEILEAEMAKTRRTISTRMLLDSIPDLVLAIKPCVMVSPMSVGVMLQNPQYKFDLVVFDQASSILFEESIPAITRASQLVVIGDINQLPTKEYFALSDMQEAHDMSGATVEENAGSSNSELFNDIVHPTSILEKCLTANIETKELYIHYQSRCEDIVCFANKYIYEDRLVTVPSPTSSIYNNDIGVHYVYVSNGIYDRGGKNNNYNESIKVVSLVLESMKKYPSKSIGVITLSEAQQGQIVDILNQYRENDASLDHLFDSKITNLFVKTLESIQCDEDKRDIIIVSIGFGKDSLGKLELNFGSLCKNGGEKRLNTALTRAGENLKFVTSVLPHEIDINSSTPKGIVTLYDYMIYASSINRDLWVKHLTSNEVSDMDIRKIIGKFIEQKVHNGVSYGVKYYLGNSNIKIDIAVYDKRTPNKYILGIVLDGSLTKNIEHKDFCTNLSYVNLLCKNGWNIFATWSYNWVMDNESEKARLIRALTAYGKASQAVQLDSTDYTVDFLKYLKNPDQVKYVKVDNEQQTQQDHIISKIGFSYYEPVDLSMVVREDETTEISTQNCVKAIVEKEYPIQFDYMCKQVCLALKEPKITVRLKGYIKEIITKNLASLVYLNDNFYYLETNEEIPVRVYKKGGVLRPIQNISIVEIASAMLRYCTYIKEEIQVSELFSTILKFYGYAKMGANIKTVMVEAFELFILSENIIVNKENDSVRLKLELS